MVRWIGRPPMPRVLNRRSYRELTVRCGFNGGVRVGHSLTTSTVTGAPDLVLLQLGSLTSFEFVYEVTIFSGLFPTREPQIA